MSDENDTRARELVKIYEKELRQFISTFNIPVQHFPILMPHNLVIVVDDDNIHIAISTDNASRGVESTKFVDYRGEQKVTKNGFMNSCRSQLGLTNLFYLSFPTSHLKNIEEAKIKIKQDAEKEAHQFKKQINLMLSSGLKDSFDFLDNAKNRYNSNRPEGFGDCKANCRKALISAIKSLTGQENINEGLKILNKEKFFGKREKELIDTFGKFLSKLHGLQSKGGPHIPNPTQQDALFVLHLTQVTIEYLAQLKITKMLEN